MSLNYAVPSDGGGLYYVRVWDRDSTRGLLSQYLLSVDLADTIAPEITSTSLPELGSTSAEIVWDRFTLGFSEDLTASTVNDVSKS